MKSKQEWYGEYIESGVSIYETLIEKIQIDAYNQAIEDAVKLLHDQCCEFIVGQSKIKFDKTQILKLKKL